MPFVKAEFPEDIAMLAEINDLGKELSRCLDGRSVPVVLNVTCGLFVGAMKAAGKTMEDLIECAQGHWDEGGGLIAEIRHRQ